MKRRRFMAAGVLTAAAAMAGKSGGALASGQRQYLELRHYAMASLQKRDAFNTYLSKAMIPALNRLGVAPVGVFRLADNKDLGLHVLLPHNSLESAATAGRRLLEDANHLRLMEELIGDTKEDPAYARIDSQLLLAFDLCPRVVPLAQKKDTRVFQLRVYESHNTVIAMRKVEMFDKGIIALFRRTGVNPVFMGECLIGGNMPSLSYMVGFDDADAQKKAWDAFRQHPEWKKMQADPYYKDTVSKITNLEFRPTAASQL